MVQLNNIWRGAQSCITEIDNVIPNIWTQVLEFLEMAVGLVIMGCYFEHLDMRWLVYVVDWENILSFDQYNATYQSLCWACIKVVGRCYALNPIVSN